MGRKKITKSGVFMIFNRLNDKVYICTSIDANRAWSQIKYMLKNNKYKNTKLQEDWNNQEGKHFGMQVLEEGLQKDFYALKKKYIQYYKADKEDRGYNSGAYTYNI